MASLASSTPPVMIEWEVLRCRRLKLSLVRARGLKALERFLRGKLDYDLDEFIEELAEDVVRYYARNEPGAVDCAVNEVLADIEMDTNHVLDRARAHKAKLLVREYVRCKPDAVTVKVKEVLAGINVDMDDILDRCAGPQGERTRAGVRAARTGRRDAGP